ncbi:MAG: AAA family ATPase [Eubacteriales bacterium]|nr:AAA family ATPase [Eubacteriales bacterium]
MNIKRAKEEIKNTIQAYLLKDSYGEYEIPVTAQRPVLLIGAPGIGKTQIMEQIARECGIALVSYTITHHTRQSAIGLPFISKKIFDGEERPVTEYTMSEIVASVYEKIEKTGISEGILFIDEINCVSETLAPAMLQFLQCKTFGSHEIPKGWLIVAAGNPPEYNKSVREFDVVTMDRVKKIEVEPDFEAWKEYAYQAGVHPAVMSYLNTRPGNFYRMESTVDGKMFATPRGWEDLSRILTVYEKIKKPLDRDVAVQYIQYPKVARDFANYLELFYKYRTDYQLDAILQGHMDENLVKKAAHASFDERLSVTGLLLSRLNTAFRETIAMEKELEELYSVLTEAKEPLCGAQKDQPLVYFKEVRDAYALETAGKKRAELLTREEDYRRRNILDFLDSCLLTLQKRREEDGEAVFAFLRKQFGERKAAYEESFDASARMLEYAFDFMEAVFKGGQELVIFITELNTGYHAVAFLQEYDCERYYRYNKELLFREKSRDILRRIEEL